MAEAEVQSRTQCKALTEDGERCSRRARDDGFCYQHDESDPTVSDSQATEQEEQAERTDETAERTDESADGETQAPESRDAVDMTASEKTDPEEMESADDAEQEEIAGILSVRKTVQSTAGELIGHEFDGVSEITPTDDGWRAVVEVVERRAVPDTQDIIGRYEIELDANATVHGYRRLDRYRRGDTAEFE